MGSDPALRVLLALILACLLLLVAQGFTGAVGQGPYRISVVKGARPWLMRVNTETGQVERLQMKKESRWAVLGELELDLAELEAAELDVERDEEPADPFVEPSGARGGRQGPDAPLDTSGDTEFEALVEALGPQNPQEIRAWAAGVLGSYAAESPDRSLPVLIDTLDDPDATVVAAAARSLGQSGRPAALPALRQLEDHPDAQVQAAAREAVARLE